MIQLYEYLYYIFLLYKWIAIDHDTYFSI